MKKRNTIWNLTIRTKIRFVEFWSETVSKNDAQILQKNFEKFSRFLFFPLFLIVYFFNQNPLWQKKDFEKSKIEIRHWAVYFSRFKKAFFLFCFLFFVFFIFFYFHFFSLYVILAKISLLLFFFAQFSENQKANFLF